MTFLLKGSTLAVLLTSSCNGFQAPMRQPSLMSKQSTFVNGSLTKSNKITFLRSSSSDPVVDVYAEECAITPEGYGFSSPISRIMRKMGDASSFTKAKASESVVEVMQNMDDNGVILVFNDNDDSFVGLFTERDFIRFNQSRTKAASNEEESAQFLLRPVSDFMTKAENVVSVSNANTASQAITLMESNKIRHLVVGEKVSSTFKLQSQPTGVINMQSVMSQVQKDERLSLKELSRKYPGLKNPLDQMREEIKSTANTLSKNPETAKEDLIKYGTAALSFASFALFLSQSSWLHEHADLGMIGIFVLGYIGIIFEEVFEFNKGAIALLMSTGMWITYADFFNGVDGKATEGVLDQLKDQLAEVSDICFFLLAASAIVEVVDAHQGFKVVTNRITTKSKKTLFWTIGFLTFFLSAILNNLTVTIVMVSLLRKLIANDDDRRLFGAMVVVAANAGGVWTPIGDVTTTMLWINNQLSTIPTVTELVLPSVVCLVGSLFFLVNKVEEDGSLENSSMPEPSSLATRGQLVFWTGIATLLSVPVFNELTGLPPYLAMLTGLGAIWLLTDVIHLGEPEEEVEELKVPSALAKIDTSGILFFLGILMSIGVLDQSGLLKQLAIFLDETLPSQDIIATVIGIASALIDNVPLVAATMGMYDLADYGTDDKLWQLIALCAGTGGSILVIGSASGVALMGLEKVDFLWYAKNVSIGAAVGYFAGIATYLAQNAILNGLSFDSIVPPALAATDIAQNLSGML